MPILKIGIHCGATTCASEPGKFCRYLGASHFGTSPECLLFPGETSHTPLEEKDGWVQRCKECLETATLEEPCQ